MEDISLLIGGKAGFGIDRAGGIIGRLLNRLGRRIYIYRDYPSIIRGGHTFSIIRASENRIATHADQVDIVIALNQETLDLHKGRLKSECLFLFDAENVKANVSNTCGLGLPIGKMLKEEGAPEIMRNTCVIGALTKAIGVDFGLLEEILKKEFTKDADLNIKVARRGFNKARELTKIVPMEQKSLPIISGNQAIALGLIKGGLDAFMAYPMTPTSPILHYLAELAGEFSIDVLHPESEIGVMLMALGYSYMGKRSVVATSGGGFCLMTEGLSFAGMAELPIVMVLGQRPGPSTGLPTYSAQTELSFALSAGQGEFIRFVVAPGDAEEAYYWAAVSMNMSWKYRIPSIILSDKNMGEGIYNFDIDNVGDIKEEPPSRAFVPAKDVVIKANSYEHDESGITTEDPKITKLMAEKRLGKEKYLSEDISRLQAVNVYGDRKSKAGLLCWGSNKGVSIEVAQRLGLRVIQPVILNPFPLEQFRAAVKGVKRLISIENNATGQLSKLIKGYGFDVNDMILKYDGRPFSLDELEGLVKGVLR